MDHVLKNILDKSACLFQQYGIRSVTMDDISKELSISKKTLYKYVKDKKDLVEQVLENVSSQFNFTQKAQEQSLNAIEEYYDASTCIRNMVANHHPSIDFDLRKYYPELHKTITLKRREKMEDNIRSNMQRGIKEGYYRDDFNIDIITIWHITRTEHLIKSDFFRANDLNTANVMDEIFSYHLHAIATPKGIKEFQRLIKNKDLNEQTQYE